MYNETIMILSLLTLILAPLTTIIVAFVNTKTVNKKLLEAQTASEKQKKVANIYYERRAETLLQLYESLSVEYNLILNLLYWLLKLQTDKFAREDDMDETYAELISKNKRLCKEMLQSKIFISQCTYAQLYKFVSGSQALVSAIVDCFECYKKIDPFLLEMGKREQHEYFTHFLQEIALQEIGLKLRMWEQEQSKELEEIKEVLKETLKSPEIL